MDILIALSSKITNPMGPDFFNVLASKQASKQALNYSGLSDCTRPNAWARAFYFTHGKKLKIR
jgi:hypothetical protein